MTNDSSFTREVDEALRRERLVRLWRRYRYPLLGLIALVVLVVGGRAYWLSAGEARRLDEETRYVGALTAPAAETGATLLSLQLLSQEGTPGYRLLASLRLARLLLREGRPQEAVQHLQALAADESFPSFYRELAELYALQLQPDLSAYRQAMALKLREPGSDSGFDSGFDSGEPEASLATDEETGGSPVSREAQEETAQFRSLFFYLAALRLYEAAPDESRHFLRTLAEEDTGALGQQAQHLLERLSFEPFRQP